MARVQLVFDGSSRGAVAAARQTKQAIADTAAATRAAAEQQVKSSIEKQERLKQEIADYKQVASEAKRGSREQVTAAALAAESQRKLAATVGSTHKEVVRYTGGAKGAREETEKLGRGALAGSGLFHSFGRSIAFASAGFLGAAGFISVVKTAVNDASDLREQIEKTNDVFRASAPGVVTWSKTLATSFGIGQREGLKYASTIGNILVPMGVAPSKAAEMSKRIVQLAADMGAFNNLPTEEVLQKITAGLAGMPRPLREVGVFLDANRIKAEAFSDGLVKATVSSDKVSVAQDKVRIAQAKLADAQSKYAANTTQVHQAQDLLVQTQDRLGKALAGTIPHLTQQQKTLAAYNIILRDSRIQQGNFAKTSGDLAQQQKILRSEISNLLDEVGAALLPTVTRVITAMTTWLGKSENQQKVTDAVRSAVAKLTEVVKVAWPEIQKVAHWADLAAKAVGGWKNALELLVAVSMLNKIAKLRSALVGLGGLKLGPIEIAVSLVGSVIALNLLDRFLGGKTGFSTQAGTNAAGQETFGTQVGRSGLFLQKAASGADVVFAGTTGSGSLTYYLFVDPASGQIYISPSRRPGPQDISPVDTTKGIPASVMRRAREIVAKYKAAAPIVSPTAALTGGTAARSKLGTSLEKQPGAPIQSAIVTTARTQLGIPYQYGGPAVLFASTDCSGLVKAVLDKSGITGVPRTAEEQYQQAPIKDPAVLLPGDLVFYDSPHIGHVGIYIGDGQMIVDPHTGDHVKYESITGPGPVVATARWWDTAAAIHGTPTAPAAPAAATDTHAGADTGGVGALTVAHPPKKGRKTAAPSIQQQLDALFGIKETLAQRTQRLSDDATVIAAELRWVDEQLAGKPNAADRLDLERLKTDLLAKAKDIVKQEQEKQKKLAAEFAAQQKAPGPTQPELEHAATRPGRASELGAVGVEASRAVIDKRLALDAAARRAAHEKELADEQARWKRLQDAGARGVKRYNDAIRAAAQAGLEMLRGVDLSKRLLAGLKELPKDAEVTIGTDLFGRPIQMSLTKVRARIAELVNIIQTGTKQAREKALAELGQLAAGIGQAMTAAAQAAQQHVDALRTAFETAFGRVSDSILTGFDRQTQATVTGMQAGVSAQIDAINRQTQAEIDQLNEQVSEKISSLQKATQAKVKQLQEAGQAATPAEAQISSLQAQHDAAQAAQALADAQRQLQQATTPEERAAAQKQIDELLYQQRIAALQKVAQAERAARDKQTQDQVDALQEQEQKQEKALQKELSGRVQALQDEAAAQASALQTQLAAQIQSYEDQRAAQRQWLADQLLAWQTNIENGTATLTDFVTWLQGQGANGVLQGVDLGDPVAAMGDAGQKQGSAFADAFIDELRRAYQAYLDFQAAISGGTSVGSSGGPPDWGGPPGSGGTPPSRQTRNGGGRGGGGGRSFAFAMGGVVPGTYVGRQDTIAARVTPGEEVIDRRDVLRLARFLDTVDSGGGRGPAVVINKPNFFGGTPRQVNQAVARSIEPHLGRLAKYRSPL